MRFPDLLERDDELAALGEVMESARRGTGAMALVTGAAGMGKSRLLERAQVTAAGLGMRVLTARGVTLERDFAFGVVRQLFEPALAGAAGPPRAELLSGAAAHAGGLFGPDTGPSGPASGEFAGLNGLYWLALNLCGDHGLALFIDDLHWADRSSLRFLAHLLPRLEGTPLAVLAGTRPAERGTDPHLLDLICLDPVCRAVPLRPLTPRATSGLLERGMGARPDEEFARVCHRATGGNPLLLAELARGLAEAEVTPVAAHAGGIEPVGAKVITRRVAVELRRLTPAARTLTEVLAVMAPHAGLEQVARVAGLDPAAAAAACAELSAAQLVREDTPPFPGAVQGGPGMDGTCLEFTHPLVQNAVYRQIGAAGRLAYHEAAARLLKEEGARAEQVAAHLLRLPPAGDEARVAVLRQAAEAALSRRVPEPAFAYLERALAEPPGGDLRVTVLTEAGLAGLNVDKERGARYLTQALAATSDPYEAGRLAVALGMAMLHTGRPEQAIDVLTAAVDALPETDDDLRRHLEAVLLSVPPSTFSHTEILRRLPGLRRLPPAGTVGALLLDGVVAVLDADHTDPGGLERARKAVADPRMTDLAAQGAPLASCSYFVMMSGDLNAGIAAQSVVIEEARARGSINAQILHLFYRAMGLLGRGDLADAEADLREGLRLTDMIRFGFARLSLNTLLAQVHIERGDLHAAVTSLEGARLPAGSVLHEMEPAYLLAYARVRHAEGRHEEALDAAEAAGRRFGAIGGDNPAVVAWRSQAALSLHALGRNEQARRYAQEEVALATRWGAPQTLGHALRVAGMLRPGPDGAELLRRAVAVLERSPARLAHAYALVELGTALRRDGEPARARTRLAAGLELALRCGATGLAGHARTELRTAGGRPRPASATGGQALTAAEHRVAELAAEGLANRLIAQRLYITVKTVEVHLSNVYRKLGVSRRHELHHALTSASHPSASRPGPSSTSTAW
ncbi:AAA family ATPase [Sphaerisporangium sp. B11E5]|uniref:ATP-binding protein n=1 Tax=Sphaerisporangium sp. B11E5 TaxID=3153563 RepID=UPI00325CA982